MGALWTTYMTRMAGWQAAAKAPVLRWALTLWPPSADPVQLL